MLIMPTLLKSQLGIYECNRCWTQPPRKTLKFLDRIFDFEFWAACHIFFFGLFDMRGKQWKNVPPRSEVYWTPNGKGRDGGCGSTLCVIWWADVPRIENRSQTFWGQNKGVNKCICAVEIGKRAECIASVLALLTPNHLLHSAATGAIKTV